MSMVCSSCGRASEAADARYCMFCGSRLDDSDATCSHVANPAESQSEQETVVDDTTPSRIGGYRIIRQLGAGGMGSVYEADDESGQRVALKLLSAQLAGNPTSVERFRQEGRLASQIIHPRCVFVYRADADAGRPFIVMELMPGKTLKDLVAEHGPLTPTEAVDRILDVVDGLIEAHRLGLIHRDVKPSNCFLTADNRVKIGDFGLSKSLIESDRGDQLTSTGAFLGTVLFAPPEQIRGEDVGYDSDVYAVCATLYFLLTGKAPYQHESMTAVLARAISEPPPSPRSFRPDVPKALDRAVRKGLERDRHRRYQSLEELRDALQQLKPEGLLPARTRFLAAAYIIDTLFATILIQIPIDLLEWLIGWKDVTVGDNIPFDPIGFLSFVILFGLMEGITGATPGKWLLNLRVTPRGGVGAPGVAVGIWRSLLFQLAWLVMFFGFVLIVESQIAMQVLGVLMVLGSFVLVAYRRRTSDTNRGFHDLLSNCHVVTLPRPPHRVRLTSPHAYRFDRAVPDGGLPTHLSGFTLRGNLVKCHDGSRVWLADDRSLGRRILLHLHPAGRQPYPPPTRPTRLRILSNGELQWKKQTWEWTAFAAPAGAPLADLMPAGRPLSWPDARLILEQLVEELHTAERDNTLPEALSINHIWSESGGRVFLLDFPVTSCLESKPVTTPMDLMRQAASLMLEGRCRVESGPIRAPLPPAASRVINRLFDHANPHASLEELQCELAESHAHAPAVTMKMRATHLGLSAVLLAFPLLIVFIFVFFSGAFSSMQAISQSKLAEAVVMKLDQPEQLDQWRVHPRLSESLAPNRLVQLRQALDATSRSKFEEYQASSAILSRPERYLLHKYQSQLESNISKMAITPETVADLISRGFETGRTTNEVTRSRHFNAWLIVISLIGVFAAFAFVFRGGLSYVLANIALVQRDGRKAGRVRCALREIMLWLPLLFLLSLAIIIQVFWPAWLTARLVAFIAVISLLAVYVVLGLRDPEEGPLDRLFRTYRVPA